MKAKTWTKAKTWPKAKSPLMAVAAVSVASIIDAVNPLHLAHKIFKFNVRRTYELRAVRNARKRERINRDFDTLIAITRDIHSMPDGTTDEIRTWNSTVGNEQMANVWASIRTASFETGWRFPGAWPGVITKKWYLDLPEDIGPHLAMLLENRIATEVTRVCNVRGALQQLDQDDGRHCACDKPKHRPIAAGQIRYKVELVMYQDLVATT